MKKLISIFLILFCILFVSCKLKYTPYPDSPYSEFIKNSKKGIMVTSTQQILIPAKFTAIDRYLTEGSYTPNSNQIFYIGYQEDTTTFRSKSFLFNVNGKLLSSFEEDEGVNKLFYHNKQLYLIAEKYSFGEGTPNGAGTIKTTAKLFRINENNSEELCAFQLIKPLGKNMIFLQSDNQIGYFDLNQNKKIVFDMYSEFESFRYLKEKNEIWAKKINSKTRIPNPYYGTVIDSTLNIKPNTAKNVMAAFDKYYFSETEKGIQIIDYDGTISPFAYPYLMPVKNTLAFHLNSFGREDIINNLFAFSPQKNGDIQGVIEQNGNIILPAEFYKIAMLEINYYTQSSPEFETFFDNNNLRGFYYYTVKNENNNDICALYNKDGKEIIKVKAGKDQFSPPEFDLWEKNRLQIKFKCGDSLRVYDLKTKKLIFSEKTKR